MNLLTRNWRNTALAGALLIGLALPAFAAAYEKAGLIVPPGSHVKIGDNSHLRLGDGANSSDPTLYDVTVRWDGTDLDWLPNANNTIMKFGDGTTSFDLWVYGSAAGNYFSWDASANDLKMEDSVSLMFGTGSAAGPGAAGDAELRWDGTDLDLLAAADDQVFKIGNGTNSWDLWLYGNVAADYVLWDASAGQLSTQGDAYIQLNDFRRNVSAKTANYTVTAADSGTFFTTAGAAGAVTFTLPATGTTGLDYTFCNAAAQNMIVTAPTDELVTFNNINATSVAFQTTSELIGGCVRIISDANQYIAQIMAEETQTVTVTD